MYCCWYISCIRSIDYGLLEGHNETWGKEMMVNIARQYLNSVIFFCLMTVMLLSWLVGSVAFARGVDSVKFGVIGDYGSQGQNLQDVADLIISWNPDFIITLGDNNYPDGEASTIDPNIGQYFHDFIYPYFGNYGNGADTNRFFPSLGNHDWHTPNAQPYLDYFTLPGNERYYDFAWGPVHFFALDSDGDEPDGSDSTSIQAAWLQNRMLQSTEPWKVVYFHHPPYSSGHHGSTTRMRWSFREWGATAVMAGHDHTYERLLVDSLVYFVNGLGGRSIYSFMDSLPETRVRYNGDYGAMFVTANLDSINFKFITRTGILIDSYTIYGAPTGITGNPVADLPEGFALHQNYPNPFNPSTLIRFDLSRELPVKLEVFNILSQSVAILLDEVKAAGTHSVRFSAKDLPGGIYFYRLTAGGRHITRRMVLLK